MRVSRLTFASQVVTHTRALHPRSVNEYNESERKKKEIRYCIMGRPTTTKPFCYLIPSLPPLSPERERESLASGKIFRVLSHLSRDARASSMRDQSRFELSHTRRSRVIREKAIPTSARDFATRFRRSIFLASGEISTSFGIRAVYIENGDVLKPISVYIFSGFR